MVFEKLKFHENIQNTAITDKNKCLYKISKRLGNFLKLVIWHMRTLETICTCWKLVSVSTNTRRTKESSMDNLKTNQDFCKLIEGIDLCQRSIKQTRQKISVELGRNWQIGSTNLLHINLCDENCKLLKR